MFTEIGIEWIERDGDRVIASVDQGAGRAIASEDEAVSANAILISKKLREKKERAIAETGETGIGTVSASAEDHEAARETAIARGKGRRETGTAIAEIGKIATGRTKIRRKFESKKNPWMVMYLIRIILHFS